MEQNSFDAYLLSKYDDDYNKLYNGIHHYETVEIRNSQNFIVLPAGLEVESNYSISYYDYLTDAQINRKDVIVPVTNYEYEERLDNNKRSIFILKKEYLGIILNDMTEIMEYREGSSQYVSENLKRAENIRLYS